MRSLTPGKDSVCVVPASRAELSGPRTLNMKVLMIISTLSRFKRIDL